MFCQVFNFEFEKGLCVPKYQGQVFQLDGWLNFS